MKPAFFPYPLNIGTDVVHLPRILRLISRRDRKGSSTYLPRFARRILCEQEQQDFRARFFPPPALHPISGNESSLLQFPTPNSAMTTLLTPTIEMARWLAGRFAAKEAARKASPGGAASIGWQDILVRVDHESPGGGGRPEVVYLDRSEQSEDGNGRIGKLSISHDGDYVIATVLAVG